MQIYSVIELARELRLSGFADALELQTSQPGHDNLPFSERLGALFLSEKEKRHDAMLTRLFKDARLKLQAAPEDLNASPTRVSISLKCESCLNAVGLSMVGTS